MYADLYLPNFYQHHEGYTSGHNILLPVLRVLKTDNIPLHYPSPTTDNISLTIENMPDFYGEVHVLALPDILGNIPDT